MSRRRFVAPHWTWSSCTHQHSTQCKAPARGGATAQTSYRTQRTDWLVRYGMSGAQRTDWMKCTVCGGVGHMHRHLDQEICNSNQGGVRITHFHTWVRWSRQVRVEVCFSVFSGALVHSVPLCVPVYVGRTIGKHLGLLVDPSGSYSARRATLPGSETTLTQWELVTSLRWMVRLYTLVDATELRLRR